MNPVPRHSLARSIASAATCRHVGAPAAATAGRSALAQPRPQRSYASSAATPAAPAARQPRRPHILPARQPVYQPLRAGTRSLFIQTEATPNADALKFKPNTRVLPEGFGGTFVEYLSPRSTLQAPHPSPLAAQLLAVDGVSAIFYGADYITVTKASDTEWHHVKPDVFSLITEAVSAGKPFVTTVEAAPGEAGGESTANDTLEYDENDSEVVSMIKELLDTRIRPAIQEDGGDIEFRGFSDGWVSLKLRGACRTCDSSTVTLRNGIESMLMHYIEEVKGVQQVLDQEEEIAMQEFARFEAKLKEQKGPQATSSTGGKGTLDSVDA